MSYPKSLPKSLLGALALGLTVTLSACGSDSDDSEASLRIIHGSPDAPPVNAKLDGSVAISDLDYAESTGFVTLAAGTYDIAVEGIIPAGNVDVITLDDADLAAGSRTTILAINPVTTIAPLTVPDSAAEPGANEVALTVTHASTAADAATNSGGVDPGVDIYVTAVGANLNTALPAFNFVYGQSVDAGALAVGTVQIRATVGGSKDPVYDSGPVDLTPFAGQHLLAVALDTVNPTTQAASIVQLLVATDTARIVIQDADTAAAARVVHGSPDADAAVGDVEVWATSSALAGGVAQELIPAFGYRAIEPGNNTHVPVPAGDYVFNVDPDTQGPGAFFESPSITLSAGQEYSVIAAGNVLGNPDFGLLLSADDSRSVTTQASVKVIHAVPNAQVDVFVTPAGTFTEAEVEMGMAGDPLLEDFTFGMISEYFAVTPGDYDIRVVAGGDAVINFENQNFAAGSVTTAVAVAPSDPQPGAFDRFDLLLLGN